MLRFCPTKPPTQEPVPDTSPPDRLDPEMAPVL